MDMQFNFSDVQKMSKTYDGGPKIVMEETRKGVDGSVNAIKQEAMRLVPIDTHNLQRSLHHEVVTKGNSITGRAGTNEVYAEAVEKGRRAGAAMPPPSALIKSGWLRRHGIDNEFAFVVARSIGRRGTRAQPYLKPALAKNRVAITREMTMVIRRISKRLAQTR